MFKTKKSKFIIVTILSIVVLLCLNPLIGMMNLFFGLNGSKTQTIDGDVDVSVTINVELGSSLGNLVFYFYYVEFDFTYNTSVTAVEIETVHYRIYYNTENLYNYDGLYWPNAYILRDIELDFGDNLTCQGSVDLNYQLNSNPQNGTVNYSFVYSHSVTQLDAINYVIFKNAIFLTYIASFIVVPIILYFIIHPDFHEITKEEKEKNEEYRDYLTKGKQNKSEEGSINS